MEVGPAKCLKASIYYEDGIPYIDYYGTVNDLMDGQFLFHIPKLSLNISNIEIVAECKEEVDIVGNVKSTSRLEYKKASADLHPVDNNIVRFIIVDKVDNEVLSNFIKKERLVMEGMKNGS